MKTKARGSWDAPATLALGLALGLALVVAAAAAAPCSSADLAVLKDVDAPVKQCSLATGLRLELPPRSPLDKAEAARLCGAKACLAMLGAMDDLGLPRCDVPWREQNETLQASLDRLAALCDQAGPAPPPLRKKKEAEDASGSASASGVGARDQPRAGQKSAAGGPAEDLSVRGAAALTLALVLSHALA